MIVRFAAVVITEAYGVRSASVVIVMPDEMRTCVYLLGSASGSAVPSAALHVQLEAAAGSPPFHTAVAGAPSASCSATERSHTPYPPAHADAVARPPLFTTTPVPASFVNFRPSLSL